MAYANTETMRIGGSRFIAQVREILGAVSRYAARQTAFRQTLNELETLTDRELADLGISRADIRRVAREAADLA